MILNLDNQEIALNVRTVIQMDKDSVDYSLVTVGNLSEDQLAAVKKAIEEYSGGGDYQAGYDDGAKDATIDITNQQSPIAASYKERLSLDEEIAALDANDLEDQKQIFDLSYKYLNEEWHSSNPLCFTALKKLTFSVSPDYFVDLEISFDKTSWQKYTGSVKLNTGDKIYLRSKSYIPILGQKIDSNQNNSLSISGNPESICENLKGELKNYCYAYLFYRSSSSDTKIMYADELELPATELAPYCYHRMFENCTALTTAPELPATTLATGCYYGMFEYCKALTTAPELPATELAEICYDNMFYRCSKLTTAPELPATTLANNCYNSMFYECSSLTTAPELPATTLASSCYYQMFYECSSLTTAPELPATTLASSCYYQMFYECSSLTTAPELPATGLVYNCYNGLFNGCSNLNYIKVGATSWNTSYTSSWVNGVSSTGTFVKPFITTISTGINGIPSGWTVENEEIETENPLCFTAEEDNSTIKYNGVGSSYVVQTSTDGNNWSNYTNNSTITLANTGDKVYFRGSGKSTSSSTKYGFTMTGKIAASGSVMSLIDATGKSKTITNNNQFHQLFRDCTSLTTAPELPATTLASSCYENMFRDCSSLTTAPELPATTLASSCYSNMFYNCSSLTTAPELPATTLANNCYNSMFYGCSKLNHIKVGATSWNINYASNWVSGVSSTGTFVKPESTEIPAGNNGIPTGWTVENV